MNVKTKCLFVAALALFTPFSIHAQTAACGNAIQWGCAAYLIGGFPSQQTVQELKQKNVQTVVLDGQHAASDTGTLQALRSVGINPVCYVNLYCEARFGGCSGPTLPSNKVSSDYNEVTPQPNSSFFFININSVTIRFVAAVK